MGNKCDVGERLAHGQHPLNNPLLSGGPVLGEELGDWVSHLHSTGTAYELENWREPAEGTLLTPAWEGGPTGGDVCAWVTRFAL